MKFRGGPEASGILVLGGAYVQDPDDQYKLWEDKRQVGLIVCGGTSVVHGSHP